MWILMISRQGGYVMHSAHLNEADARSWAKCKQQDGNDVALLYVNQEQFDEILTLTDVAKKGGR